ncbi:MAG: hypothetical protein LBM70_02175 [Victivallales bacterium]|jgi:type II secretory pathway component GspD/PulD (secretin)|nr:hypothetical protein [Victivallales bacterium]
MNPFICKSLAALIAVGSAASAFAAEPASTAVQPLSPTQVETAGEKVQKITFMQDDAQLNIVSKVYELKNTNAADLAPFVKSAVIRFTTASTVTCMKDKANSRELLIVSTAQDMMPYIDDMVAILDRPGKMNDYSSIISGTGIAYGTYQPQFRAAKDMRNVIVDIGVDSGPLDSRVRLDSKTNMFYFKDSPARVASIKEKLSWLDKEIPQARIELKIYEVRDSDLTDVGIDYLAWKNGPGLNLFEAGFDALNMRVAETLINQMTQTGVDLFGNFSYGFGGMYTAPAFDLSFIRLLQQNGKATINSTASVTISNAPGKEFKVSFSPEYQNIMKDEDHISSVDVGGSAALDAVISGAVITGGKDGAVCFDYAIAGSNVVERNNLGAEIVDHSFTTASTSLDLKNERLLASWKNTNKVEQTIGIPFLCELPILKYIFGTTTSNMETTHYFVTARAIPVSINEDVKSGLMTEFDELAKK